jgi:hypothetical protein
MVMVPEPEWTTGTVNTVTWYPFRNARRYVLQRDISPNFLTPEVVEFTSETLVQTFMGLEDGFFEAGETGPGVE